MSQQRLVKGRFTKGFTLVELLTVVAIIGVLATLTLSALASAKRKSRTALCTANLHQVALGMVMYLDDAEKRPDNLGALFAGRYLKGDKVVMCPEDRSAGWGSILSRSAIASMVSLQPDATPPPPEQPTSYFTPLRWTDDQWIQLAQQGAAAGLVTCQLHGLGKPDWNNPSLHAMEGLVLRGRRDGAVVRKQVYWAADQPFTPAGNTAAVTFMNSPFFQPTAPWSFFSDETEP